MVPDDLQTAIDAAEEGLTALLRLRDIGDERIAVTERDLAEARARIEEIDAERVRVILQTDEDVLNLKAEHQADRTEIKGWGHRHKDARLKASQQRDRLTKALEWACKQLGHAPEMSPALEWAEKHIAHMK